MEMQFMTIFANALSFAFQKATIEGKVTIGVLAIVSLFSWTEMVNKARSFIWPTKPAGNSSRPSAPCATRWSYSPKRVINRRTGV
jgi:hypothetical protein